MSVDILLQIVLVLAAIALIFFMVVLLRLYAVLGDVKETTGIAKKRAHDIDNWIEKIEGSVNNLSDIVKAAMTSLESFKTIKEAIIARTSSKSKGAK